ncbi:hypothetical protein BV25DRAFT_1918325 [Artomyces pyxidatus]|uniref:Uncharacterized protein n=1 Tax=Artomyces pyxidatus TaxID=48021 RepID=A0ACB8SUJ7_9AGAM|nr:hypothetical protein BV25DRAFT_1918325 [Artomyces pyxidatus]
MSPSELKCAQKSKWGTLLQSRLFGGQVVGRTDHGPDCTPVSWTIELRPLDTPTVYSIDMPTIYRFCSALTHARVFFLAPHLGPVSVDINEGGYFYGPTRRFAATSALLLGHRREDVIFKAKIAPRKFESWCGRPRLTPLPPLWPDPLFKEDDEFKEYDD